jgi:hypothetical protein
MTCRRICRELLWLTRFGEIDQDSAPHLEHLAGCHACRDEVGFDRAMVQQLRHVLAERVGDATPSPAAWGGVLDRMRQPERQMTRVRAWTVRLAAGLRVGTTMAGASLALVVALNLGVVPLGPVVQPDGDQASPASDSPRGAHDGIARRADASLPRDAASAAIVAGSPWTGSANQADEQLPLGRIQGVVAPVAVPVAAPAEVSDVPDGTADFWQTLATRLVPADAARMSDGNGAHTNDAGTRESDRIPDPPVDGPS